MNPIDIATRTLSCTQAELAELLGVSPGLVSMWRHRGYVTVKHLKKAVEVTGLPSHILDPRIPPSTPPGRSKKKQEA